MLDMKTECERCSASLVPTAIDAVICSFECTFCSTCGSELGGRCPNCAGELVRRPTRTA